MSKQKAKGKKSLQVRETESEFLKRTVKTAIKDITWRDAGWWLLTGVVLCGTYLFGRHAGKRGL